MKSHFKKIAILLIALILQACGAAHIKPTTSSNDLTNYSSAYISKIEVRSEEQNEDSIEVNKKMEVYADTKLRELIAANKYSLVTPLADTASLEFNLSMDVVYGSRAARYWAGFGAGKGTVKSVFEVRDSSNNEVKYSASGASDLSVGVFGGSMETVIKENIDELIAEYHRVAK